MEGAAFHEDIAAEELWRHVREVGLEVVAPELWRLGQGQKSIGQLNPNRLRRGQHEVD